MAATLQDSSSSHTWPQKDAATGSQPPVKGDQMEPPHIVQARRLIGRPGSRHALATPALLLDLDAFEENITRMATRCRNAGVALRPHAKSHKCGFIARAQIAAGAAGLCCAKLGEAEALFAAGVDDFLLTSPLAGEDAAQRAARLAAAGARLAVTVDHPVMVDMLAGAAVSAGVTFPVLIDVDIGLRRSGVAAPQDGVALAARIAKSAGLRLAGVQAYGGAWQHLEGAQNRFDAAAVGAARLKGVLDALEHAGVRPDWITGGGTGSCSADIAQGLYTELQCGSYALMDRQYRDALKADPDGDFRQSLIVQARIVSANAGTFVTIDVGLKALASDAGPPSVLGPNPNAVYFFFGDEHGGLAGGGAFEIGARVELAPPHCDPTVDRYDWLHLVRGDVLEDVVAIEARGRSQ
jgi:D-serine deaminase-like pyridoxal phosphate-dependent protein